jgi:hypothetical protein
MTHTSQLLAAMLLAALSACVWAAHPLVTDDTGTQDEGNSQIELNSDVLRFAGVTSHVAAFTYTYGVLPNLDVFANLPAAWSSPSGIGDASVGAKWRFWESGESSLALKPELILPTGNENKGLGNGKAGASVGLLATRNAGPAAFHANIGVLINRFRLPETGEKNRRHIWRASAAVTYEVHPQTRLAANIGVSGHAEKETRVNPAFFLIGLIFSPVKSLDIDIGFKRGLNSAEVDRQFGGGLTFRY